MSRFISKQSLTEEFAANPLATDSMATGNDTTAAQEAIIQAMASETDAINQYEQILRVLDKSEDWLKKEATPVIEDLSKEEQIHLGQLYELVSKLPRYKENIKAGENETTEEDSKEEEVKESVPGSRTYSSDTLIDFLADRLQVTDDEYDELLSLIGSGKELQPKEVDQILLQLDLTPEQLEDIENSIVQLEDPIATRKGEFKDDTSYDARLIEDLIEKVTTVAAKEGLSDLMNKLRGMEYDGSPETGWRADQSILYGSKNPTKTILS